MVVSMLLPLYSDPAFFLGRMKTLEKHKGEEYKTVALARSYASSEYRGMLPRTKRLHEYCKGTKRTGLKLPPAIGL